MEQPLPDSHSEEVLETVNFHFRRLYFWLRMIQYSSPTLTIIEFKNGSTENPLGLQSQVDEVMVQHLKRYHCAMDYMSMIITMSTYQNTITIVSLVGWITIQQPAASYVVFMSIPIIWRFSFFQIRWLVARVPVLQKFNSMVLGVFN